MIPSDKEYGKYVTEKHLVTCNGTDEENSKWLTPKGDDVVDTKGRVHVEYVEGQLRLIFDNVTIEDQGNWTCVNEGEYHEEVGFILNVYTMIKFENAESVLTLNEGHDATIRCEVKGHPEPSIKWFFNGQEMTDKILG